MGFGILIDATAVQRLAARLGDINAEALGQVSRQAVNDTADAIYELARPRMIAGINLTDEYVKSKMEVRHASASGRAQAVILAKGSKPYQTQLRNYGALQKTQDVNWSNERIAAAGHPFGKWPGWTKRKGDKARGIPVDQKQAGISVEVTRGTRQMIEHGFLVQLNNGNGMGVATRSKGAKGEGAYKVRYGPSVYQLFRHTAAGLLDEAGDQLEDNLVTYATQYMERQFE